VDRPHRLVDFLTDLLAFAAGVLLLLVIPRVLDLLDAVNEWWRRRNIIRV
jgi:hypothetical protein